LRALTAVIDGLHEVESVLDEGLQAVAMSATVWHQCGLPLDPSVKIALTSANGETRWSLGLCRNVPFNFKGLEVLLQVHIIEHAAYDVLLGCPFSMLCETKIDNRANGEQILTICNPNTGMEIVIPTHER
ncbi:hypothetical protein EV421DRAFT_1681260, partial [Armillaria borealis]